MDGNAKHGIDIASAYNRVVISLANGGNVGGCTTTFPLWSSPLQSEPHETIVIAHVYGNHFIKAALREGCPPMTHPLWRTYRSDIASRWEDRYDSYSLNTLLLYPITERYAQPYNYHSLSYTAVRGLRVGLVESYKQAKEEMRGLYFDLGDFQRAVLYLQFFPRSDQDRYEEGVPFLPSRASKIVREELSLGSSYSQSLTSPCDTVYQTLLSCGCCTQLKILRDRDDYYRKSGAGPTKGTEVQQSHRSTQLRTHQFPCTLVKAVIFSGNYKKNIVLVSSGRLTISQKRIRRVFGTYSGSAAHTSDSARITHVYRDLPLQFDDKIRSVNALPLDMCEFDIILGIDWLAAHRATIDCHSRRVIFGDIHAPEFIYHGSLPGKSMKIISALKARTLLSHGCEVRLFSEFQDVIPEELPGIPLMPIRDVGVLTMILIPRAEPISKALIAWQPD
ncbi:putative reverse transcriptase domain, aspartic peptidase domain protein [Tanacetum coccineum]